MKVSSITFNWAFGICQFLGILFLCAQTAQSESLSKLIVENQSASLVQGLRDGANANSLSEKGVPLLLLAWQHNNSHAFEILLEMGANPHSVVTTDLDLSVENEIISIENQTPLIAVCVKYAGWRPGLLERIIGYLRFPNQVDSHGRTIFHHHANANLPGLGDPIVPLMLNCGVDPNAQDANGFSAVRHYVRRFLKPDELLLPELWLKSGILYFSYAGADVFQQSTDGSTLFDDLDSIANQRKSSKKGQEALWSYEKTTELRKYLNDQRNPTLKLLLTEIEDSKYSLCELFEDKSGQEVCYWAENYPEVFDHMLNLEKHLAIGGYVDHEGAAGITFLWAALQAGNLKTIRELLENGANPDTRLEGNLADHLNSLNHRKNDIIYNGFFGVRGETVLLAACSYPFRRKEFIGPILSKTTELDQTDELGRNALHRLLYHPLLDGQEDCLIDLITAGVPLNAQTISGATPCHVAVPLNPAVIPALVYAGANPEIRNMHGQNVVDLLNLAIKEGWPRQNEYHEVLEWLHARKK